MRECRKVQYRPEGMLIGTPENREILSSESNLERAATTGKIIEGMAVMCDRSMTLQVDLGCMRGIIPREEAALTPDGAPPKDIAVITRVGKPVCFCVMGIRQDAAGPYAVLSRRAAQYACLHNYLADLIPGDIVESRVTHMEQFGAYVDIGCGIVSLLSIDCISVSRISHPKDRFSVGDTIRTVIRSVEMPEGKIYVSHKELLGTWEENAAAFSVGQTVAGIVRSVEEYGIFVELTPNLAGLAEYREGVKVGQAAAVYIKNMIPERMKIKLVLVDAAENQAPPPPIRYFLGEDRLHIDRWLYSPSGCQKTVESVFESESRLCSGCNT